MMVAGSQGFGCGASACGGLKFRQQVLGTRARDEFGRRCAGLAREQTNARTNYSPPSIVICARTIRDAYNIMDSGFADQSATRPAASRRQLDQLCMQLRASRCPRRRGDGRLSAKGSAKHPGYNDIAASWGFAHVHVRGNCAIMAHKPLHILEEPSEGDSTIVAMVDNVTYIVTSMSSLSYAKKVDDFRKLGGLVNRYSNSALLLMGDLNTLSPQDAPRYNASLLCGNGTYDAAQQTGEYVENYCLPPASDDEATTNWVLDYPLRGLLETTDLTDLCYLSGGFYDIDTDQTQKYSQCGFSNPTLLIHMTGAYGFKRGSHATIMPPPDRLQLCQQEDAAIAPLPSHDRALVVSSGWRVGPLPD